jgi:hypothetical protein
MLAAGTGSRPIPKKPPTDGQTAEYRWFELGKIVTGDGKLLAFDPGTYYPDPNPPDEGSPEVLLEGAPGPARLSIKCLTRDGIVRRVAIARLLYSDTPPSSREPVGTVTVETSRMALAVFADLENRWRVGGPLSRSSVVPSTRRSAHGAESIEGHMSPRARTAQRAAEVLAEGGFDLEMARASYHFSRDLAPSEVDRCNQLLKAAGIDTVNAVPSMFGGGTADELRRAAEVLRDEGYPVELFSIQYDFRVPLSDDGIARANQLLRRQKIPAAVSTPVHQTRAEIQEQMEQTGVGRLTSDGKRFLVTFPAGMKEGRFTWDRLLDGGNLVGFECTMIHDV